MSRRRQVLSSIISDAIKETPGGDPDNLPYSEISESRDCNQQTFEPSDLNKGAGDEAIRYQSGSASWSCRGNRPTSAEARAGSKTRHMLTIIHMSEQHGSDDLDFHRLARRIEDVIAEQL